MQAYTITNFINCSRTWLMGYPVESVHCFPSIFWCSFYTLHACNFRLSLLAQNDCFINVMFFTFLFFVPPFYQVGNKSDEFLNFCCLAFFFFIFDCCPSTASLLQLKELKLKAFLLCIAAFIGKYKGETFTILPCTSKLF